MEKIFFRENKRRKTTRIVFKIVVYVLALVGFLFITIYVAMKFNLTNEQGGIDSLSKDFNATQKNTAIRQNEAQLTVSNWANTPEWKVMSAGFLRDKDEILKASKASGVPARMIISSIIAEQFRFFNSNREVFKKFFQPLGILGNSIQFSYGVAGIKIGTARKIEKNLKDPTSPYYLGPQYEHLLDFTNLNTDKERMARLTDPKNYYYSYLYAGLLLKEETTQWKNAGYPIDNRPEILATLFNIGFIHSIPNANPQTGGSVFTINGKNYTFGGLAFDFYYSNELSQDFPPN